MGKKKEEETIETINKRVREIRKSLGMTQQKFAEAVKLTSGNTFSMIERGESKVTEQNIQLLCTPNQLKIGETVNPDWLRTGKGEMFVPKVADGRPKLFEDKKEIPQDEEELVGIYRQLSRPNKTVAVKQIDILLESQDEPVEVEKGDMRKSG